MNKDSFTYYNTEIQQYQTDEVIGYISIEGNLEDFLKNIKDIQNK